MKSIFRNVFCVFAAVIFLALNFSTPVHAQSEFPYGFDLGDTVISMDAGTTRDVWMWSRYDYTYHIGDHTSKQTYLECTFKGGTEYVKIHIGPDEQVKNVFFYFYVDQDPYKSGDNWASIEVYVQNIKSALVDTSAEVLKSYSGNSADFNAYYYYVNYPDLQAAYGKDGDKLLEHYNAFGRKEGRVATRIN